MHEVRQRVRETAAAWCAYAWDVPQGSDDAAWLLQTCFAADGGEAQMGMTLAQYSGAVLDWVTVLRTTGAYPKDRASVELAAWKAAGL